jgi:GNAT superfamily N-acetyltransferase
MTDTPEITISLEHPSSDDAQGLIRRLDEDLLSRYPTLQTTHGLHPRDLTNPDFTFVVARMSAGIGAGAVGCGALRGLETGAGEVKRMYVLPEFRGRGIARRILEALETKARDLGRRALRLETGAGQPEAIALYRSAGYREIPAFGEYANNPFSVCFEKRL